MLARDRTTRTIYPHQRLGYADLIAFALVSAIEVHDEEPRNFKYAMRNKEREKWMIALNDEIKSLHDNNTWSMIKRPIGS